MTWDKLNQIITIFTITYQPTTDLLLLYKSHFLFEFEVRLAVAGNQLNHPSELIINMLWTQLSFSLCSHHNSNFKIYAFLQLYKFNVYSYYLQGRWHIKLNALPQNLRLCISLSPSSYSLNFKILTPFPS
jgi:hypothetical protein